LGYSCKGELDLKVAYVQQAISEKVSGEVAVPEFNSVLLPKRFPIGAKDLVTHEKISVGRELRRSTSWSLEQKRK